IEHILKAVPEERQLLFFSATIPRTIQDLISRYAKDPAWIKIESVAQNRPQVDQTYFEVDRRSKIEALTRLIDVNDFRYGIIFCSTKIMVDDLDEHLHSRGYMTDRLHGDISQAQRDRVMEKFRRRAFEFLVATDVAARGLDVDDLEVVFNFDLPNDAEDYTHRIGRTGRAGRKGQAFTFVSGQEIYKLQSMVRWAKLDIRRGKIPSLDEVEEARSNVFFEKIRATLDAKEFKPHDQMIDRLLDQGYASTDICSALIHLLQGATAPEKKGAAAPPPTAPAKSFSSAAKPAPAWAKDVHAPRAAEVEQVDPKPLGRDRPAEADEAPEDESASPHDETRGKKQKYERPARTGKEAGMATVFLNVGRKQLVTPADIVGKIAGVTRLPAGVVGALDIHQRHTLVDVADDHVEVVVKKLTGIRLKGVVLAPAKAGAETQ
ncbi:MAG TPA: DEAD/DEAH box helicase, partial [Opitutaceae bacterium]|nr:DEAD/DEAH box helicase [Opitutaceae bacterium]